VGLPSIEQRTSLHQFDERLVNALANLILVVVLLSAPPGNSFGEN
jgi:hypothetical protein